MPASARHAPHEARSRPVHETGRLLICQLGGDGSKDSNSRADDQPPPYPDPSAAALALLNSGTRLTRKAGSFLGQIVADPAPLTPAQNEWLGVLLERAGLPGVDDRGRG